MNYLKSKIYFKKFIIIPYNFDSEPILVIGYLDNSNLLKMI